jgi:hypothetical protein
MHVVTLAIQLPYRIRLSTVGYEGHPDYPILTQLQTYPVLFVGYRYVSVAVITRQYYQ